MCEGQIGLGGHVKDRKALASHVEGRGKERRSQKAA